MPHWYRIICNFIKNQGRDPKELGLFYSHGGPSDKTLNTTIQRQCIEIAAGDRQYLMNPLACILTYEFNMPLELLSSVIHPDLLDVLKPQGGMEAVIFPCDTGTKVGVETFKETVIRYIKLAEKRIWVSEYLPGRGDKLRPKRGAIKGWMTAHKEIYEAIEGRLDEVDELDYRRVFRTPIDRNVDNESDSQYYGLTYSKSLTLGHMLNACNFYKERAKLYTAPVKRTLSYVLIDDKFLIREYYNTYFHQSHDAIDLDMLTVERANKNRSLQTIFEELDLEMKDLTGKNARFIDFSNPFSLRQDILNFYNDKIEKSSDKAVINNLEEHKIWLDKNFKSLM